MLHLFTFCWSLAGIAVSSTPMLDLLQELVFALVGAGFRAIRPGKTAEDAFELIDLLADLLPGL